MDYCLMTKEEKAEIYDRKQEGRPLSRYEGKFICKECGEFTETHSHYCQGCGMWLKEAE